MRVTTSSVTDDTVGFDGLRAVVGAGDGVVGRFPGIVCVARSSDPEPLREFLAVCAAVAGPEPGRALARRLATWMSGPDAPGSELRFGTVAAAGDQLAVYLVGDVEARVDAVGGLALSGAHAAIGTDRLLSQPSSPLVLSLDGGDVRADPADVHDLRAGVVPGAGVVLRPTGFAVDEPARAEAGAVAGHEWFDTGEDASDPFADPPRAPGVPAQRVAGVQAAGRNGVARETEWEATAEADEPEPAGGPGRHALEAPLPPSQGRAPHAELQSAAPPPGADLPTDAGARGGDVLSAAPPPRADAGPRGGDEWGAAAAARADSATNQGARGGDVWGAAPPPGADPATDAGARGGGVWGGAPPPGADPATNPGARGGDVWGAAPPPGADSATEAGGRGSDVWSNAPAPGTDLPNGQGPRGSDVPPPRADPPSDAGARGGDPRIGVPNARQNDAAVDPLTDPLAPELDAADPFAEHPRAPDPRGAGAHGRNTADHPTGDPVGRLTGYPNADPIRNPASQPTGEPTGHLIADPTGRPINDPTGRPTSPPAPSPVAPHVVPAAEARAETPLEQRRPRPFAGRPDPAFGDPAAPPDDTPSARHGLEGSAPPFDGPPRPEPGQGALPVRSRPAGRTPSAEPSPAGSLFAPAREPDEARGSAVGSLVDLAPGRTPPHGFAPAPNRDPETRPPPDDLFDPPPSTDAAPNQRRGPRIRGYRCENGHLNDPRSASCRDCAAPIDERVGGLVAGPRPALGRLVFDDGAAHVVDGGYLLGRAPDTDERVRAGELRPIVVDDQAGSVAQAHAEIRVSGWDVMVVDAGSRNGTYVSSPDEGQWTPLPPRRSRRLLPGTRVRVGGRMFVFESSSTVR